MTTYNYECTNCKDTFEHAQKMQQPALVHCTKCGQPTLRRLIQKPIVIFKGSGFAANDLR